MIIFIDDINMPVKEVFGAQPPIELLRQIVDQKGFFDLKKLLFVHVQNLVFVGACGPPGGGRQEVTPRLFRHFNIFWVPDLGRSTLETIYTKIFHGFLKLNYNKGFEDIAPRMVNQTVDIFLKTVLELLPVPAKCHYTFNTRDIARVFQGMLTVSFDVLVSKEVLVDLWLHEL
jgi:dynein heavy chain, axonemal